MEINGYPKYLLYEDGRVWSTNSNTFLKPQNIGSGYLKVLLSHEGTKKNHLIHRLVALHYIPNPENKTDVDHIDRNKANNDVSNLRWATRSENLQNTGKHTDNTSGHKNISYYTRDKVWVYAKMIRGKEFKRCFKTLTDALCYKYICLLKQKSCE